MGKFLADASLAVNFLALICANRAVFLCRRELTMISLHSEYLEFGKSLEEKSEFRTAAKVAGNHESRHRIYVEKRNLP